MKSIPLDLKAVMDGMAQLELADLESIASKVNQLVAQKKAPNLPAREAFLLQHINNGLPVELHEKYRKLMTKSADEALTEEEHQELLKLVPVVEAKQVERLKYLVELAQLRNTSVDDLMDQLGIAPPEYV